MPPAVASPLNCHFRVVFDNPIFISDIGFYTIQGLSAKLSSDVLSDNTHVHFENIRLTRAYRPDSKLIAWCMEAINNQNYEVENFRILLLGAKEKILSTWLIKEAVPAGWSIEEFHAQESRILLETIELRYSYFEVVNSKGQIIAPKTP